MSFRSKAGIKVHIQKLSETKELLEREDIIQKMLVYWGMDEARKEKLLNDWDLYYSAVWNTAAAQRFLKQKELSRAGDYVGVRVLANDAKEAMGTYELKKPSSVDPVAFDNDWSCLKYKHCIARINELKGKLETDELDATVNIASEIFSDY